MLAIKWVYAALLVLPAMAAATSAQIPVTQAIIEAVQMPAWLERGGRVQPLAVGTDIRNGDRIRTGSSARIYLDVAEGSTVKLGENAAMVFYSRSLKPVSKFKGALDVLNGAFRFTTHAGAPGQRDIAIRVGVANAGIRGADLWGKSDRGRDLILLLEGRIEVRHAATTFEMAEPLTYFAVPRNSPPQSLTRIDPESFKRWALETELLPGDGAARRGGKWNVLLARADDQRVALEVYDKARNAGYAAQVRVRPGAAGHPEISGDWNYEVVLTHLPSEQAAAALAARVKSQLGVDAIPVR